MRRNDEQKRTHTGVPPLQGTNFPFTGHGTISWEVEEAEVVVEQAVEAWGSVPRRRVGQNPV